MQSEAYRMSRASARTKEGRGKSFQKRRTSDDETKIKVKCRLLKELRRVSTTEEDREGKQSPNLLCTHRKRQKRCLRTTASIGSL
jgi:hypothetical protein